MCASTRWVPESRESVEIVLYPKHTRGREKKKEVDPCTLRFFSVPKSPSQVVDGKAVAEVCVMPAVLGRMGCLGRPWASFKVRTSGRVYCGVMDGREEKGKRTQHKTSLGTVCRFAVLAACCFGELSLAIG